ncbi:hypothetical protein F4861DRAFT_243847 [Xylaria intraflava]|nr:hypothetical protein F4861DRAFT_243847 [Xylaria intraflava]
MILLFQANPEIILPHNAPSDPPDLSSSTPYRDLKGHPNPFRPRQTAPMGGIPSSPSYQSDVRRIWQEASIVIASGRRLRRSETKKINQEPQKVDYSLLNLAGKTRKPLKTASPRSIHPLSKASVRILAPSASTIVPPWYIGRQRFTIVHPYCLKVHVCPPVYPFIFLFSIPSDKTLPQKETNKRTKGGRREIKPTLSDQTP